MKKAALIALLFLGTQAYASNDYCRISKPLEVVEKSVLRALKADLAGVKLKPGSLKVARIADFPNDPRKTSVHGETSLLNFSITMETVEGYQLSLETQDYYSKKFPFTTGGVTLRPGYYIDQTERLGNVERYCESPLWGRLVLINRSYNKFVPMTLPFVGLIGHVRAKQ